MEAIISIKSVDSANGYNGFSTLTQGTHYLTKDTDGNWQLTTVTPEVINEQFYRSIIIENVLRENGGLGNIDTTGT